MAFFAVILPTACRGFLCLYMTASKSHAMPCHHSTSLRVVRFNPLERQAGRCVRNNAFSFSASSIITHEWTCPLPTFLETLFLCTPCIYARVRHIIYFILAVVFYIFPNPILDRHSSATRGALSS